MKNKLLVLAMIVATTMLMLGCGSIKISTGQRTSNEMPNTLVINRDPLYKFYDLDYGLVVQFMPIQQSEEITKTMFHLSAKSFFYAPTIQYVRTMGLKEKSSKTDYRLIITYNRIDVDRKGENSWIELKALLEDAKGDEVFSQIVNAHYQNDLYFLIMGESMVLDEAYTQALEQINWNRIASFLRTEQLPKEEPQKQVQGYGDTALESTIIRWDVQSRPQGADIFWRVVSKTPEVKSTNNKYLQTTPYEATKSLDIKGLTYQTSGDVRIILRCEKDGYHPQEKEYNVRMIIDQEEISAFFRLVKEGE